MPPKICANILDKSAIKSIFMWRNNPDSRERSQFKLTKRKETICLQLTN
jgi:hypothetical protein